MTADRATLKARAAALPERPGIYFFKGAAGEIVYIGRARSLRDRVRTYFLPRPDIKVRQILAATADIDYILTGSEREAAFLENNYVQECQPRFNLRLKDDKSFPYLKLSLRDRFPGISFSRRVEKDGARYFGPFSPAGRARTSIRLVNKNFRVRGCAEVIPGRRRRPCLEYELGLCSAPCVGLISEEAYREDVESARLFLEGKTAELLRSLRRRMAAAAAERRFEEAARWRDLIRTVEDIRDRPRAISTALEDQDAAGFARRGGAAAVYVFRMRGGKIRSSREIQTREVAGRTDAEILAEALAEVYRTEERPARILLPFEAAAGTGTREARGAYVVPKGGRGKKLVDLASRNAESILEKAAAGRRPVDDLARVLGLAAPPRRIEGFDISNTGGEESVGSLVVFLDGRPAKDEYRMFRIKTVAGSNDVASLREVVRRRYTRRLDEHAPLPELVMVDGGKGQLAAAGSALEELGLGGVPLISLAKREEILFTPSVADGLRLDRTSPALKLVQAVRDEAHRFAVRLHRRRREKRSFASEFDGLPDVGPKRKAALQERYGTLAAARGAPRAELEALVGRRAAATIKPY
jgi:excinuclease ABC subunit C